MKNEPSYRTATVCTAVTGSMTMAMKAQRALAKEAIRATVVKVSKSTSNTGCIYGIEFDISLLGKVRVVLENAGVDVREYLR